ncbi:MAG TPA: group I intron-associated PD-(D/E)XK endonuclease [Solirubrobacteraceae bacterium]|nr:group I intron-associated PD-(D/E)XK endonuclease [Solirubrobacteraceae bacterium]
MAPLKAKGDLAEMMVAADLLRRGHKIAFPFGEDWDYDLIVARDGGPLERVQVKHTRSDGRTVVVRCRSFSLTNGKVREVKKYTSATIDWIAAWDATTQQCFYVPASELGEGRAVLHLRLDAPRSGRRAGIRWAADYRSF